MKRSIEDAVKEEARRYVEAVVNHNTHLAHIHRKAMLRLQHSPDCPITEHEKLKHQVGH